MEGCRVINYTDEWKEALRRYMRRVFKRYSEKYIDYCIEHSSDRVPSLLVINQKEEVVGCHLYYCTKALLNGEMIETQWGHDTFLDEEYRKEIGLDFMMAQKEIPGFGIGLTAVNKKLHKLMRSVFLEGVFTYYTVTPAIILSPFQKLFRKRLAIKEVEALKSRKWEFMRVKSASEMHILNHGYWYRGFKDIDFIRDSDFLDYRFFHCQVYDYRVYASENAYFVVRASSYRGLPAMMLSDFRYNPTVPESVDTIIKAVMALARKSGFGIVYFVCGDKNVDAILSKMIHFKTPMDFISSYKISPKSTYVLSGGDSDADFIKT